MARKADLQDERKTTLDLARRYVAMAKGLHRMGNVGRRNECLEAAADHYESIGQTGMGYWCRRFASAPCQS